MSQPNYKLTRYACYYSYLAASSVFSLPPLLFLTFHEKFDVSYTLLGTLVLINFCTQLFVDLMFSFFSKHFNVKMVLRIMPLLTSLGLGIYAIVPSVLPQYAYAGLVLGTLIFSVAAGLGEVLISPVVAALPSKNSERDMSLLHSLYAYGVLMVVLVSSAFLTFFGTNNWMYLTLFWAALPIGSCALFCFAPLPDLNMTQTDALSDKKRFSKRSYKFILCFACIFLGGAAENAMTNWISSYIESVFGFEKIWGDVFGMAAFAVLLGLSRSVYAKYGKNISNVILIGMIGATICYLTAGLSSNMIISMLACVLTGMCTAMFWPGTLILMEEEFPHPGVAAYALMAAGGDLGSSIAPQLLGVVVDTVSLSEWAGKMSQTYNLTAEQIGMKIGMLSASIFSILGIFVIIAIKKKFKNINYRKA